MYLRPLKGEDWVGLGGAGAWIPHTSWGSVVEPAGESCAARVSVCTSAARGGQAFALRRSVSGSSNALRIWARSHHQWPCAGLPDPDCLLRMAGQKAAPCRLLQAPTFGHLLASSSLSLMLGATADHFVLILWEWQAVYIALSASTVLKTVEQKRLFTCACCSAVAELSRD